MTTAYSMQAALYVRQKQRQRKKKIRRDRLELPSNVATKEIAPFPRYPPHHWVRSLTRHLPNSMSLFARVGILLRHWKCKHRGGLWSLEKLTLSCRTTYICRIAPVTSRFCILYIIQQIYVQNILNMLHTLRFFLFKMPFIS